MRTIGIAAVIGARQRLIASWLWSAERVRGALEVLGERSASRVLVAGEITRQVRDVQYQQRQAVPDLCLCLCKKKQSCS